MRGSKRRTARENNEAEKQKNKIKNYTPTRRSRLAALDSNERDEHVNSFVCLVFISFWSAIFALLTVRRWKDSSNSHVRCACAVCIVRG